MSNTHDTFLTGSLEREDAFLRELSALLNRHCIDSRVNAPDYALANHLLCSLQTLQHTLHMHFFPRSADRGYAYGQPYPWGKLPEVVHDLVALDETMELAKKIREQLLEKGKPCYICHGTGYLVPQAVGAPTLERWLNSMRELNEKLGAENTQGFKDLQASAEDLQQELTQLEIDPTKLSDAEKARILHNYDWSDNAPDNALQRAGRRLMEENQQEVVHGANGGIFIKNTGGGPCSR